MTPHIRVGVLALAGLTAVLIGLLAGFDRVAQAGGGEGDRAELMFLPLESLPHSAPLPRTVRRPRDAVEVEVARLARATLRARARAQGRARRTHFPVRGAFNWGQGGARFGAGRSGHSHEGQDVFARTGTPLVAVQDGTVLETGNDGGRGNYVAMYSPEADRTYVYLHLHAAAVVSSGARVLGGQRLGGVGCTGSCWGDHLHFEVRRGRGLSGAPEDPLPLLQRWARAAAAPATLPPGAS